MASWFEEQNAGMPATGEMSGLLQSHQRLNPGITLGQLTDPANRQMLGSPVPGAPAGGSARVNDADVQAILQKYPATNEGMRAAMVEIDRTYGPGTIKLLEHPQRLDKLVLPDGRTIDTIVGAGGANPSWGWMVEGGGHGGGGGAMTPQGVGPLIGSPMAGRPLIDDPSYQFRFGEGMKALERSAAAKGTLLTGGMLKGLLRYGQDYASTEYGNAYNRAASEQQNNYQRLYNLGNLGLNATGANQGLQSGYAGNIGNTQLVQGQLAAGGTLANAGANAQIIDTLGGTFADWLTRRNAGDPNNPGGRYIDAGRGLY